MSTFDRPESEFTEAASLALEELINEYRNELRTSAVNRATRFGERGEVTVRDILAAVEERSVSYRDRRRRQAETIFLAYSMLGMLAVIGSTFFLLGTRNLQRSPSVITPLLVMVVGATISAAGMFVIQLTRSRERSLRLSIPADPPADSGLVFMREWIEFELSLRQEFAVHRGESAAGVPLSQLIRELAKTERITIDEERAFANLLRLRNEIVHGVTRNIDTEELQRASRDLRALRSRVLRK